jgi:tetratricopeptide (TPR) repeat protein
MTFNTTAGKILDRDLLPFVNRQPRVLHALTIGGLPKVKIESCLSVTQSNRLLFPGAKKSGGISSSANQTDSTTNQVTLETSVHESHTVHSSESRLKALKLIHRLSQDTVVDMQLTEIIGLEKTIRDKALSMADILAMEHAFDQEAEDDPVTAAKLFVKMKKRFKLPHLPTIALGVLYFKQKKYREAIDEFTHAVKFQAALPRPIYSVTDDVTALYNRALCYFRVGNDSAALLDLEQAVGLDGKNLKVDC